MLKSSLPYDAVIPDSLEAVTLRDAYEYLLLAEGRADAESSVRILNHIIAHFEAKDIEEHMLYFVANALLGYVKRPDAKWTVDVVSTYVGDLASRGDSRGLMLSAQLQAQKLCALPR